MTDFQAQATKQGREFEDAVVFTPFGGGMVRRPGGRWFFVLTDQQMAALLREATTPLEETA